MDDIAKIGRLIEALRPWLGHLVIVGGWAHRLHRLHPLANPPSYLPLRTKDADLAFSLTAPLVGDIGAALKEADFAEEFFGDHTPPVTHYRLGKEDEGFYVEFLAPLDGNGLKRSGVPNVTIAKAGVTAQKLRHLDILLMRSWTIQLGTDVGVPLAPPALVMLANPVTFIAQKLLIQRHRAPDKQAEDTLYIHDTLELFGGELEALKLLWLEQVRPMLAPKAAKDVVRLYRERFGAVTDVIRNAARIPTGRVLVPERLQAACAYGLEAIFGIE